MKSVNNREHLELLETSILHRNVLVLQYRSPANGNRSDRNIEPLGIYFTQDKWMLVAFCRLRSAKREFRLDGVLALEETGEQFPPHQFTFR
ncbi:WYL domain-containing protein [Aggregatimonas sangjinii]|uniref:WYL domain-containing protein n=1 Tax=Aggregatimonas sangjinii TaxID=2583587 RepID=A0A5B7SJF9_9FLAO|nr:WYL domain-containing protein [Aggregatimonas sangjinii]QCW98695.1 WYL domain-containing protein [Aggregatimonas sangjinii]